MAPTLDVLFSPWIDFWNRSAQLAAVPARVAGPGPDACFMPWGWAPSDLLESQQQLWEKTFTASEMWWTLWMNTCSPTLLLSTRGWDGEESPALRLVPKTAETAQGSSGTPLPKRLRQG
ncbi:hypothetical protein [Caldimonas tepidiphila]|uniref:hypothetical protein n=1 Tax=Caldimonas tepidiphila TaxID=2315841 RepID=UPI000E5AA937|nr:hypothetical protein [Caldimonas tepidiphila]